MGAIGNLISGLFGGAPQKAPGEGREPFPEKTEETHPALENKEHSPAAAELAKTPEQDAAKTNPAEFIKNTAPNSEEEFSTFPLTNFFGKLKSLASGTKLAEFLDYGVDLTKVNTFDLFQTIMAKVKSKVSKEPSGGEEAAMGNAMRQMLMGGMDPNAAGAPSADEKEDSKNPKAQAQDLQKLENDLAGLENMLKGLEPEKKPEAKADDKAKPSPAKTNAKAPVADGIDSLLKQITA